MTAGSMEVGYMQPCNFFSRSLQVKQPYLATNSCISWSFCRLVHCYFACLYCMFILWLFHFAFDKVLFKNFTTILLLLL